MRGNGQTPSTYSEAVYHVVHHSTLPPEKIADYLGIAKSTLYNAANPNMEDIELARKHIIPVTNLTRNYAILDYEEAACGRVAFEIPVAHGSLSEVSRQVSSVALEFSHLLAEVSSALADNGRVDKSELPSLLDECQHLIREVATLMTLARKEAEL